MSARAGRSRFFIGIVSLILMIGFVAIFHSSQQQLDESRQSRLRCEQQQEALNARLQAIVEHKFRVEKALETERREHLESKQHFEQKAREQKDIHNKATMESNVRFESLQQHYKLLQSEHSDFVEECTKTKETQMEHINGLERKVKSIQSQLQLAKAQSEKDVEQWKVKYEGLEHEKQRLEVLLHSKSSSNDLNVQKCKHTNEKLEKLIADYKSHCNNYQPAALQSELNPEADNLKMLAESKSPLTDIANNNQVKSGKIVIEKNFKQQEAISDDLYKINIKVTNNTINMHEYNTKQLNIGNNNGDNGDDDGYGGGDGVGVGVKDGTSINRPVVGAVINSVENFQIAPNLLMNAADDSIIERNINTNKGSGGGSENKQVLQQPPPLHAPIKTSTASSPLKIPDRSSKLKPVAAAALYASIANNPTSEKTKRSSTLANNRRKESGGRLRSKPIPIGVVPVPENFEALIKNDDNNRSEDKNNNNNNNNRYANVVDELSGKKDDPEQDNGAHEVKDDPNTDDDKNEERDHLREVLDNVNNAAEEDTNNFFDSKGLIGRPKKGDEDVEVVGNNDNNNKQDKAENLLENDDKLINEVVADQGKEAAFPDGLPLEEGNEEDEDEDDYSNPAARQQEGPAVRN